MEEEDSWVAVQHGVGDGSQKRQQGDADQGDSAGQPAQPGAE
jgi:hypothetical protein